VMLYAHGREHVLVIADLPRNRFDNRADYRDLPALAVYDRVKKAVDYCDESTQALVVVDRPTLARQVTGDNFQPRLGGPVFHGGDRTAPADAGAGKSRCINSHLRKCRAGGWCVSDLLRDAARARRNQPRNA